MSAAQDRSPALAQVVASSGTSFAYGMGVLPARRRRAIHAIYAFCRIVDDIVDGPGDPAVKARRLSDWEDEIEAVYAGRPRTDVGRELAHAARTYELPQEEFHLILDGMRMDIRPIVAPEQAELDRYVRRVAGAVGLLSMRVFGAWRGEPSRRFALALAEAMQLTNILRDVEEDAAMGRVYIPAEILAAAEVPADPRRIAGAANLPAARQALGRQARAAFDAAIREVPRHRRIPLVPALFMMGPYERMLREVECDGVPPARRPGWRKAIDGLRCAARGGA